MAFGRKAPAKGKRVYKKSGYKKRRTTSLAAKVAALTKKMGQQTETQHYQYAWTGSALTVGPPTVFPLTQISSWGDVFGTSSNDAHANRAFLKKLNVRCRIDLNNEEESIGFSVFAVSLKDAIGSYSAAPVYNPGSGVLTLTNGIHFYRNSNGYTLLNPKCFNIHYAKSFTLTNNGTPLTASAAQTQFGTDRYMRMAIPVNKMLISPAGDWKALPAPGDPSKAYFLLIFCNNSSADLENPLADVDLLATVKRIV